MVIIVAMITIAAMVTIISMIILVAIFTKVALVSIGYYISNSYYFVYSYSVPVFQLDKEQDMCGPWIPDGGVFTHTAAMATEIKPWDTNVILNEQGVNYIIAHIRIGKIQMALGHKIHVYQKPSNI